MTKLNWDQLGEKIYETGVDHGVLFIPDDAGVYSNGYPWNGLTTVTEKPSGAEASAQFADNIKYLNLVSAEEFGATVEAFTYPKEFAQCDGSAVIATGVYAGQQPRKSFGLAYRTLVGNDIESTAFGYKLHLIYGALAAPTEKAYATVNDSPEAITFSWEVTTSPVQVPGFKPTASITINSNDVDPAKLAELEDILYGTEGSDPKLPTPAEIIASLSSGPSTEVRPLAPTQAGNVVTIPSVTGVVYKIEGEVVTGDVTITEDVLVVAEPAQGYTFPAVSDRDWFFAHI